jgi:ribosomal protein S18 acetylase RimI-like enzyme
MRRLLFLSFLQLIPTKAYVHADISPRQIHRNFIGHSVQCKKFLISQCITNPRIPNPLQLVPIRMSEEDFTFLSKSDQYRCCIDRGGKFVDEPIYELSLIDETDISNVARFIVQIFGADAINVSKNLTTFEKMLMMPAVELVNGYSGMVAFAEVYAGLRSRLEYRIQPDHKMDMSLPEISGLSREEQLRMAACTSIVVVLGKAKEQLNSENDQSPNDVIATVELRLQPCDAKIPFSLPWIDWIERKLASYMSVFGSQWRLQHDIQPYLSNLCVDEAYRGRGIGRALVRCVENIAETRWGYSKMYLHVDIDNRAAVQLYNEEGYTDVGRRWNPFWAGKSTDIGYFVKKINS